MTRRSKAFVSLFGFILLAVAVIFVYGIGAFIQQPSAAPAPPILSQKGILHFAADAPQLAALKITHVDEYPVPRAEPLNARIAYNENFTARVSSPIAGRVVMLKGMPGDSVRAGEALLALDSPELAAAVSDLRKAQADESRKKLALERSEELLQGGVLARKEYENAEADYAQATAETRRAGERLRNIAPSGTVEGRYQLRSPISGVVAERKANPGMEVRPDLADPLFVVSDTSHLWVLIDLPERDLAKVAPGQPVAVEVDAYPGERFPARIDKIAEVVDPATRRVQVRCSITNPQHRLKPEMYSRVLLLSDESRKAVRLPNTAIVTQGLYSYVFVEKEPGTFQRRRIDLSVQDRDFSYVQDGLAPGEAVVVAGAVLLNSQLGLSQ